MATYGGDGDGLALPYRFRQRQVMFNQGGCGNARRREVDLYVYTEKVDEIYNAATRRYR